MGPPPKILLGRGREGDERTLGPDSLKVWTHPADFEEAGPCLGHRLPTAR